MINIKSIKTKIALVPYRFQAPTNPNNNNDNPNNNDNYNNNGNDNNKSAWLDGQKRELDYDSYHYG